MTTYRRTAIPLGHALLRGSSDLPGGANAPSRHAPTKDCSPAELPPYLVLLRVGFAMPAALLRRRCALTAPFHPYPAVVVTTAGRYIFCGTFRRTDLSPFSRTLSGTLLCGVRTFLSLRPKTLEATARSGCLQVHYMRMDVGLRLSGLISVFGCACSPPRMFSKQACCRLMPCGGPPRMVHRSPIHEHCRSHSRCIPVAVGE